MSYYSDLSADEDSSVGEEDDFSSENDNDLLPQEKPQESSSFPLDRVVLHLDIDCFYCQCEHLDRNLPPSQPLAIGQKHIIVTSNYAARKMGVKKLQGREAAKKACPSLQIIEGSDLERYRRHGRRVYDAFRDSIQTALSLSCSGEYDQKKKPPVRRGRGMDEMQADISVLVDQLIETEQQSSSSSSSHQEPARSIYIYGEQNETTRLTEDQTGAEAVVGPYDASMDATTQQSMIPMSARSECQQRLLLAATRLAPTIQESILQKTGFTTTLGLSVNPLLAKLGSDLQKPKSINVLYPWRAAQLIAPMPLRKIPDAGHKTIKLLKPALEQFHGADHSFWTCADLLRLPKSEVKRCLESEEQCTMILQRCRGMDTTPILDDAGEAPKTISCENSFKRGTVVTPEAVWKGMQQLYVRLPRLLEDRRDWSQRPAMAYPTTLRLTVRVVDGNLQKTRPRRPFVTRSKQVPFRGQELMNETNKHKRAKMVQEAVRPLVQSLVLHSPDPLCGLNVTRLNIAVTNFQDATGGSEVGSNSNNNHTQESSLRAAFASQAASQCSQQHTNTQHQRGKSSTQENALVAAFVSQAASQCSLQHTNTQQKRSQSQFTSPKRSRPYTSSAFQNKKQRATTSRATSLPCGIDPATLAELPPEMVQQILSDYKDVVRSNATAKHKQPKAARIDQFFKRK